MKKELLRPDYLFEISWEVCNKVGGIYTVVSTKARTLSDVEDLTAVYIGPDLWKENSMFEQSVIPLWAWKNINMYCLSKSSVFYCWLVS